LRAALTPLPRLVGSERRFMAAAAGTFPIYAGHPASQIEIVQPEVIFFESLKSTRERERGRRSPSMKIEFFNKYQLVPEANSLPIFLLIVLRCGADTREVPHF
jgi:hypothetical protein